MKTRIGLLAIVTAVVLAAPAQLAAAHDDHGRPGDDALVFMRPLPDNPDLHGIYLADLDARHVHRILADQPGDLLHPEWTPDGRALVYVDGREIRIARGSRISTLVGCSGTCSGVDFPAVSPDGRSLAFTRYLEPSPAGPPSASEIVVRDLGSGRERSAAHSDPGQVLDVPRWSPDGRSLVIGIDRFDGGADETGSAIAVVDLAHGTVRRLTDFSTFAYSPEWSPRTHEILYDTDTLGYSVDPPTTPRDLFAIRPDGTHVRRITHLAGPGPGQVWLPSIAAGGLWAYATLDGPGFRVGARVSLLTGQVVRIGDGQPMTHLKQRPGSGPWPELGWP